MNLQPSRVLVHFFLYPMSCCALKSNLTPCRNWSCLDSQYCASHRIISADTLKSRWFQRYILGSYTYPIYTFRSPKYETQLLADLSSGKVILTKEDICKIPAKERYVDIYLLLLQNGFVKRGDHQKLEFVTYWFYAFLLAAFPDHDPLSLARQQIETHLVIGSGEALYHFLFFICGAIKGREKLTRQMLAYIPTLLDTEAARELAWFPRDELDKLRLEYEKVLGKEHPFTKCLVQRWLLDIKELYQTEKAIQKIKMDQCKEELMMFCWHPSRIEKYLLAGIDIMDI